jgi:hypothetical protein
MTSRFTDAHESVVPPARSSSAPGGDESVTRQVTKESKTGMGETRRPVPDLRGVLTATAHAGLNPGGQCCSMRRLHRGARQGGAALGIPDARGVTPGITEEPRSGFRSRHEDASAFARSRGPYVCSGT